jgi:hypothetical protein
MSLSIPDEQTPPPEGLNLSRFVSIYDGSYRLRDVDTRYANMPPVRQRVVIMVRTLTYPKKMTKDFEAVITQRVREGMRQMVEVEKRARLDSVLVERHVDGVQGRARLTIEFTDLTTRERDSVQQELA